MMEYNEILEISKKVQKFKNKLKNNDEINIDFNSYLVLCQLMTHNSLMLLELSVELNIGGSSMSLILKNLVRRNMVEKRRNFDDERTVTLSITKNGTDEVKRITEYLID